jgi:hypothetical protein
MQGQQQLDINMVIAEYQKRLGDVINENVMLQVYVKQLEARLTELQQSEQE